MAQPDTRKPPTTPPGQGGTPPGQAGKPPTTQPPQSLQQSFTVTVGVDTGVTITAITLSNTTVSGPADNANKVIGNVAVVTDPPNQQVATPIVIQGEYATKFALTNSGRAPCQLTVGVANLAAGNYTVILSITPTA